jgi:hypothetical protein
MSHRFQASLAGVATLACAFAASADTLHGFFSECVDNTTLGVTSTSTNPPMDFGFWVAQPA